MNYELSGPEILVFNWLTKHKITFLPQQNMFGGANEKGGTRVDFVLPEYNIVLRIQSYWHISEQARDMMQRIAIENEGYFCVDVWESKIETSIDLVMHAALRGEELGE